MYGDKMSRIGQLPISLPEGVEVNIDGNKVTMKGPKGELSRSLPPDMMVEIKSGVLTVSRPTESKTHRALHGLTRTLLANMVEGVSRGFEKELELSGVGYRGQKQGAKLILYVGYSHPVEFSPPEGVSVEVDKNRIRVAGIDKESVGEIAARIRALHPPDRYKGKGIKYAGERLRLKPGKGGVK
jgi:large subunit ribosomal protein L6